MAEFRRDPILGQWVIVHTDTSWEPGRYKKERHFRQDPKTCQFCPGHEKMTPPEVYAYRENGSPPNSSDWLVRVISNKFPALKIEGGIDPRRTGILESANGVGAHEIVIETPRHESQLSDLSAEEIGDVLKSFRRRVKDLTGDKRFRYVMVFKNYGRSAGTTVEHAHSQIIALPMVPKYVAEEMEGAQNYFAQHERCVFCDILAQEREEKERVVTENGDFAVICPYVSRYAFESWILPKTHQPLFSVTPDEMIGSLAAILKETLKRLKACLDDPAYNFYLHISPVNMETQQSFHWHIEIVPKLNDISGFEWGTGFYVVRTSPEDAARYLRETDPA